MNAATLLSLALSLLIAAQQPNVPQSLKDHAILVAKNAISVAASQGASVPATTTTPSTPVTGFQITDFTKELQQTKAVLAWKTTSPSRSRVTVRNPSGAEMVYESENGVGTTHRVTIQPLSEATLYTYKVTARSTENNLEDDFTGSFESQGEKTYVISREKRDDCIVFTVKDKNGQIAPAYTFTAKWTTKSSSTETSLTTNYLGQIDYCGKAVENATNFTFKGKNLVQ